MSSPNADMIGRDDVNVEAILAITNTDHDEVIHAVTDNADAIFTWDYEKGARPALNKLYEKAKTSQWNGETDLPWDTDVDQEAVVVANALAQGGGTFATDLDVSGTVLEKWNELDWLRFGVEPELDAQPVHARRAGALVCTAKIVETVPWIDAKYYVDPGHGRGPSRCSPSTCRRSCRATTRSTPTSGSCSTTSSPTAAGT